MKNKLDTEIRAKEFNLKEQKEEINTELEYLRQNMAEISKQMITMYLFTLKKFQVRSGYSPKHTQPETAIDRA
jgi:hypothetical protein